MIPHYERDPGTIYRKSFATIREEACLDRFTPAEQEIAIRLIHACGMVDLADDLVFGGDLVGAARTALHGGSTIFCDVEAVATGIIVNRLPEASRIVVTLNESRVRDMAVEKGTTRSGAAVDLWDDRLNGGLAVFGNAPTALFRLLERLSVGGPRPAAILAFPVGFVGAAESKQALCEAGLDIPFVSVLGRRGGSAMASAAVNALVAGLIEERQ